MPGSVVTSSSVNDIKALQRDFERSQRAARRSPRTIGTYREAIDQLAAFLERSGMPTAVSAIHREHVEAFMEELHTRTKPATASNRFRALQQFFKFTVEEGEIDRSPMERMRRPTVPVEPVAVLSTEDLRALLAAAPARRSRTSATPPSSGSSSTPGCAGPSCSAYG
jgi:site-specific recombinase XerD